MFRYVDIWIRNGFPYNCRIIKVVTECYQDKDFRSYIIQTGANYIILLLLFLYPPDYLAKKTGINEDYFYYGIALAQAVYVIVRNMRRERSRV